MNRPTLETKAVPLASPAAFRRKKTAGFSLFEVSIAVVLAGIVAAAALWLQAQQMRVQLADSQADLLVTLNSAVNAYETNNYAALANSSAITGVANPYSPTIAELTSMGLLTNGFSTRNLYGGGYQISLSQTPVGCVSTGCNITGYTSLTSPIVDSNGHEDDSSAGEALLHAGGDAGISSLAAPGTISGASGAWSMANPMGSIAGILAMRNGYASSNFTQFLRRDGSLPMTGSLNMNGQSIASANVVNSGSVSTTSISSASIANSGTMTSGYVAAQNTVSAPNGSITTLSSSTVGATQIWAGNISASGNVGVSGNVWSGSATTGGRQTVGEYVQLNGTANVGWGCSPNGLVGQNGAGQLLTCVNGVWHSPLSAASVRVVWSGYGNVINSQTGQPDAGYAACNWNEIVVGGGASCSDGISAHIHESSPSGNGWIANCYGDDGRTDYPAAAYAMCMSLN
jgi:prepilin-type N-terminal cleavage/methylation domain-containing protein